MEAPPGPQQVNAMAAPTVLISRSFAESGSDDALEQSLAEACRARSSDVVLIPHLYHISEDAPLWEELRSFDGPVAAFAWLHPRATRWVLHRHGVEVEEEACYDLATVLNVTQAVAVLGEASEVGGEGSLTVLQQEVSERWYPVIDVSRCTRCGHCLQFCIFGVYDRDASGAVVPVAPDNCKPGCPACARICPSGAIMFPLLAQEPAIAGAPGEHVVLDAEARAMYYRHTGAGCPVCGQEGKGHDAFGSDSCPECGRPVRKTSEDSVAAMGEIDALIQELDDMAGGIQE